MTESRIVKKNGNSFFEINGEIFPSCAYITYFDENNDYLDFAKAGYRLFSVTISFANQPINTQSGFSPNGCGIFDNKQEPNFKDVDNSINTILRNCPNAYIFPRVYVCMPQWWIDENPSETIDVPHGKKREALYSEKFRETAAKMLKKLIEHVNASKYADHVFGYQISGGNTQEWFHLDLRGGYHKNALPYFNKYLSKMHPELYPCTELPNLNATFPDGFIKDKYLSAYFEFASDSVAETIEYLCETAKKADNYNKVVGSFYGYSLEVIYPLWGTHKLSKLLDSKNIDFFASPNSYAFSRALGEDWGDMMPTGSIKLHDKLCFMENDIRTLYSKSPGKSREGSDPYNVYTDAVWQGPPTEELSASALRKSFARQLTQKNGLWWFDMFGGWFATKKLKREVKTCLELYSALDKERDTDLNPEIAVFVDESVYTKLSSKSPAAVCVKRVRDILAKSGVSYHTYLIDDFKKLTEKGFGYKAAIFAIPCNDGLVVDALSYCDKHKISYLKFNKEKYIYTATEYRDFLKKCGVWSYLETEDVFYIGNGFFAIHATTAGEKEITFPKKVKFWSVFNNQEIFYTNKISIKMEQFETQLFEISK